MSQSQLNFEVARLLRDVVRYVDDCCRQSMYTTRLSFGQWPNEVQKVVRSRMMNHVICNFH